MAACCGFSSLYVTVNFLHKTMSHFDLVCFYFVCLFLFCFVFVVGFFFVSINGLLTQIEKKFSKSNAMNSY